MIVAFTVPSDNTSYLPDQQRLNAAGRLVVIMGPTAVGKTRLGIDLAQSFNGEVVNADSRYLYRGFNIGVAKPSISERNGVSHHLIDVLEPDESMSLAVFQGMALYCIGEIHARSRTPFLVGGTPLYVNAVIEGWNIPRVPPNEEFRRELERVVRESGVNAIASRLAKVDPESARRCGNNPRRIIRALEVFETTGEPMTKLQGKGPRPYQTLELGLMMPREILYRVIDDRVDDQIRNGLVTEVRSLLDQGVDPDSPAFSSIGYRQLLPFLNGEYSLDEAIARIKNDTHRYVRHQETWLRKNPNLIGIDVTNSDWVSICHRRVAAFLEADL